ncbi:FadR/GntR family transcriptional regulator [Caballeronia humi]|uniref:Pyruvate dehydrogenase complex repressor n=1 Tax=Caballeronia humi TaxID=326474 RepID=A0A158FYW8_9BURK|nr:FadR/GntR family transcriptional regulator [Caballeronia humi]SAL24992.1 GntR family transcriptional regulator [Caballeronia humi]
MFSPVLPARTLTADVASQIEKMIREGHLAAGAKLPPEHELIESLSVSRTVLREAVAALRAQGLLTSRRGAGVFVAELPPQRPFHIRPEDLAALPRALDLLEFRAGIEVECAGLAAQRRTDDQAKSISAARAAMSAELKAGRPGVEADAAFHMSIAQASNNPYFPDFLNYLSNVAMLPRTQLHGNDESEDRAYAKLVDKVHVAIEKAIIAGDATAARENMRTHFLVAAQRYRGGNEK